MTIDGIPFDSDKIERAKSIAWAGVREDGTKEEKAIEEKVIEKNVENDNEEEKGTWGVTYFKEISHKTGGVKIASWDEFKKRLQDPPQIPYSAQELREFKTSDEFKYKTFKLNTAGLYTGYTFLGSGKGGHPSLVLATKANPPQNFFLLALDYDEPESWLLDSAKRVLQGFNYVIHTTASATAESPKYRIVVPFKSGVDGEARDALARVLADKIGWSGFDDSSLHWTQRMAFPVKTRDFDYKYIEGTGEYIDVLSYLQKEFPNWKNAETRPSGGRTEKAKERARKAAKRATDIIPKEYRKQAPKGLLGAFCRVYSCDDILEESGRYKLVSKNEKESRWSRKRDDQGGIVVYHDNETASCFLATDILSGERCLNAFSLALILLYNNKVKTAIDSIKRDQKVIDARLNGKFQDFENFAETWGDEDNYSRGWMGILERVCEAFPIKTIQATQNGKNFQEVVMYDGTRYNSVPVSFVVSCIVRVCEFCAIKFPHMEEELFSYIRNAGTAKTLGKEIFSIESIKTSPDDWDADPWLINCRDGVLNIKAACNWLATKKKLPVIDAWKNEKTEFFREHSSQDLFRKRTNFNFDDWRNKEAQEKFKGYLQSVQTDPDVQRYLQMAIGSSLGDCSTDNIFIWLVGAAGAGKSTLMNGIRGALGPYYGTADISNFYTGNRVDDPTIAQPQLDALRGVKFSVFSEASAGKTVDTTNIKKFFSGTPVVTRPMYGQPTPWVPRFRGICDCNELPSMNNPTDSGIRRRFRVIEWYPPKFQMDATVSMIFSQDTKIQAVIFFWMLTGCCYWASNKFLLDGGIENAPKQIQDATRRYFEDSDIIGQYIADNLEITNLRTDFSSTQAIVADFEESEFHKISVKNVDKRIKEYFAGMGIQPDRCVCVDGKTRRGYRGVIIRGNDKRKIIENIANKKMWQLNYSEQEDALKKAAGTPVSDEVLQQKAEEELAKEHDIECLMQEGKTEQEARQIVAEMYAPTPFDKIA